MHKFKFVQMNEIKKILAINVNLKFIRSPGQRPWLMARCTPYNII